MDERMLALIGDWSGEERVFATAWTQAGEAQGEFVIAPGPGGIVIDYGERQNGSRMTGHGVVCGDGFWWFDSLGFRPEAPGNAGWQDDMLVLERSSARGRTVMGLTIVGETLHLHMATAAPDAALFAAGREARALFEEFLAAATAEELARVVEFDTLTAGRQRSSKRKLAAHVLVHGVRHWAQVASHLRAHGRPTGWPHDLLTSPALE